VEWCFRHAWVQGRLSRFVSFYTNTCLNQKELCCLVPSVPCYIQQSKRLKTECYIDLSIEELYQCPRMLTIFLNSLWKLGNGAYDTVILDECGLIRHHFFSSTCNRELGQIWNWFMKLIAEATNVVLLQDGITLPDVQFFTETDNIGAGERTKVGAYKLEKPTVIHPVKYTTDWAVQVAWFAPDW
jgi:hypothetical protein